jgi:hypothetical protein
MPTGHDMNHRHLPLLFAALCLLPLAASAAQRDNPPATASWQVAANDDWNSLSAQEQKLLKQHRRKWDSYSPEQKARLRKGVKRYQNLSPEERQDAERGRERYETMSPEERRNLREKYDRSRDR